MEDIPLYNVCELGSSSDTENENCVLGDRIETDQSMVSEADFISEYMSSSSESKLDELDGVTEGTKEPNGSNDTADKVKPNVLPVNKPKY